MSGSIELSRGDLLTILSGGRAQDLTSADIAVLDLGCQSPPAAVEPVCIEQPPAVLGYRVFLPSPDAFMGDVEARLPEEVRLFEAWIKRADNRLFERQNSVYRKLAGGTLTQRFYNEIVEPIANMLENAINQMDQRRIWLERIGGRMRWNQSVFDKISKLCHDARNRWGKPLMAIRMWRDELRTISIIRLTFRDLLLAGRDLGFVAERVIRLNRDLARERGVQLEIHVSPSLRDVVVGADTASRVYDILENFLSNAIKYSNGHVSLSVSNEGSNIVAMVVDDGRGIDLSRYGQAGWRAEQVRGRIAGNGFGANNAIELVTGMGGRVEVATGGGGSIVMASFPIGVKSPTTQLADSAGIRPTFVIGAVRPTADRTVEVKPASKIIAMADVSEEARPGIPAEEARELSEGHVPMCQEKMSRAEMYSMGRDAIGSGIVGLLTFLGMEGLIENIFGEPQTVFQGMAQGYTVLTGAMLADHVLQKLAERLIYKNLERPLAVPVGFSWGNFLGGLGVFTLCSRWISGVAQEAGLKERAGGYIGLGATGVVYGARRMLAKILFGSFEAEAGAAIGAALKKVAIPYFILDTVSTTAVAITEEFQTPIERRALEEYYLYMKRMHRERGIFGSADVAWYRRPFHSFFNMFDHIYPKSLHLAVDPLVIPWVKDWLLECRMKLRAGSQSC